MTYSTQVQAVMLLTVRLGKPNQNDAKPLSPGEWGYLAQWLHQNDLDPSSLLTNSPQDILSEYNNPKISTDRITQLLDRGVALGIAVEKWERAGLWFITRSDADYPKRLKQHLGWQAPPVLFGAGNRRLLDRGGIAVVGSRDSQDAELEFARNLGKNVALSGRSVLSGGARGIDQCAMLGSLECEGTGVVILANSLLRSSTSVQYRESLMSNDLALISAFNPEAGFSRGNAMARNPYIYCLSDVAVVVSSQINKGGTWQGATANLRASWVPLWVKQNKSEYSGNAELVCRGAQWLPDDLDNVESLFTQEQNRTEANQSDELPDKEFPMSKSLKYKNKSISEEKQRNKNTSDQSVVPLITNTGVNADFDYYGMFLKQFAEIATNESASIDDLVTHTSLEKSQIRSWLKQAVEEGKVQKLLRPLRYQSMKPADIQLPLFKE